MGPYAARARRERRREKLAFGGFVGVDLIIWLAITFGPFQAPV